MRAAQRAVRRGPGDAARDQGHAGDRRGHGRAGGVAEGPRLRRILRAPKGRGVQGRRTGPQAGAHDLRLVGRAPAAVSTPRPAPPALGGGVARTGRTPALRGPAPDRRDAGAERLPDGSGPRAFQPGAPALERRARDAAGRFLAERTVGAGPQRRDASPHGDRCAGDSDVERVLAGRRAAARTPGAMARADRGLSRTARRRAGARSAGARRSPRHLLGGRPRRDPHPAADGVPGGPAIQQRGGSSRAGLRARPGGSRRLLRRSPVRGSRPPHPSRDWRWGRRSTAA